MYDPTMVLVFLMLWMIGTWMLCKQAAVVVARTVLADRRIECRECEGLGRRRAVLSGSVQGCRACGSTGRVELHSVIR